MYLKGVVYLLKNSNNNLIYKLCITLTTKSILSPKEVYEAGYLTLSLLVVNFAHLFENFRRWNQEESESKWSKPRRRDRPFAYDI